MGRVKRKKGLYVLLIGIFIFSFGFYEVGSNHFAYAATTFPKGASIGGIDVGKKRQMRRFPYYCQQLNVGKMKEILSYRRRMIP